MRALRPDLEGFVGRDGTRVHYEVFGAGERTLMLLPPWSIVSSRHWKFQVPYLARHFRVVTFDGRGNGLSDRPTAPEAYADGEFAADTLAVMDATQTERAVLVSMSLGAHWQLIVGAEHPERVDGLIAISSSTPLTPGHPERIAPGAAFDQAVANDTGWWLQNRGHWEQGRFDDFLRFFFEQFFPEPHSTKQIEDGVGWGLEAGPGVLIATHGAESLDEAEIVALAGSLRCPSLVIHGELDRISPLERGRRLAELTHGRLVTMRGSGHGLHMRDPVKVNLLIRDFVDPAPSSPTWTRGRSRRRRALYVSSPIGLGHAQRDVAIADELRKLHPDLEVDWLAQHPVTEVLRAHGERVHPASELLFSEADHIDSECSEHDLHCFQAWRRMDQILLANFMLFLDVVRDEEYDLWIGDEAWEVDYYLHENPEQKRAAYAWLTDFVGWLPMPEGGERERFLTADYNAEMIEHVHRYPRVRDRAIFVGDSADIVPDRFGEGLPRIREWTRKHFDFAGYVTGFDPSAFADRERIRAELGYRPDEKVCIVTVGGSGAGGHLLRRVIDSFPQARRRIPELRMIVVAGPRIDPAGLPSQQGLEVRSYVHELYRHLAVCDLAVVQGGLTTCMELTASRRPFLYFPLQRHFEQNFHVRHRLERYRAGRRMEFATATPDLIAQAMAEELERKLSYRSVAADGAARAAALIGELL